MPITAVKPAARNVALTHWPLIVGLGLLWTLMITLVVGMLQRTGGAWVYILDDTYIHMAMAKNIALHQVWGVTRFEFASASSSPVWTVLLALVYLVTRGDIFTPLLLNLLAATALVVVVYRQARCWELPSGYIAILLAAVILYSQLHILALTGMEHVPHALLTVVYVCLAARLLAQKKAPPVKETYWLWVLTPVFAMLRMESLFLIVPIAILLLLRRRYRDGLLLPVLAGVPIILAGMAYRAAGGHWLPDSALVHSLAPHGVSPDIVIQHYVDFTLHKLFTEPSYYLLPIFTLVVLITARLVRRPFWHERHLVLSIFVAALAGHMVFGVVDAPYTRYIHYLQVLAMVAGLGLLADVLIPWRLPARPHKGHAAQNAWLVIGGFLLVILVTRFQFKDGLQGLGQAQIWLFLLTFVFFGFVAQHVPFWRRPATGTPTSGKVNWTLRTLPMTILAVMLVPVYLYQVRSGDVPVVSSQNIYQQQIQMARFIDTHLPQGRVAVNDIGAVSFFNDEIRLLDLVGLASPRVCDYRLAHRYQPLDPEALGNFTAQHGTDLVIIYDKWFPWRTQTGQIARPASWRRVATWTIEDNHGCGDDTVSFYAARIADTDRLRSQMREFEATHLQSLPGPRVWVRYDY